MKAFSFFYSLGQSLKPQPKAQSIKLQPAKSRATASSSDRLQLRSNLIENLVDIHVVRHLALCAVHVVRLELISNLGKRLFLQCVVRLLLEF
jgi:hypothetical protein